MAASFNRVLLMGNLTRDPELRYIPSGTAVASFTVAVNRTYTTPGGEKKEEVSFIRVIVWGRRAEVCGQYIKKGSPVFVEGRLRSRTWQTPEGQNRSTIEVVASNVQFLRGASKSAQDSGFAEQGPKEGDDVDSIDLGGSEGAFFNESPKGGSGGTDEVPF